MANSPLQGYRVLDMSRILAGPWASQTLADLGAQVIKIERPNQGDDTRHWGPPYLQDKSGKDTADAAYFMAANRGKHSVTVDLTTPAGQSVIRDLAKVSDVVIENYKVDGLKKYDLDYASLKRVNPKLVYCSITGFGQTGPYKHRAGYDFMIQGMGGLMSITGEQDALPGGGPQKAGVAVADIFTGLYAANAIQAALLERVRSGEGQHIDLALFDVQAAMLANQATNYLVGGVVPQRLGNAHPNIVPYQAFSTADGFIILAVGNDNQFKAFCGVAGAPALAEDKRFVSNALRVNNRDILCDRIAQLMSTKSSACWLAELEQAGVPCGPINSIAQVFNDPQLLHRGMRLTVEHPTAGEVDLAGSPMRFSRSPAQATKAPPLLGEDTDYILTEVLGYDTSKLQALREQGSI